MVKPYNLCIWVKAFGINFYDFAMAVFIGFRDYGILMAIMALPYKWVSLFDFEKFLKAQDAMFGDTPNMATKYTLATNSIKRISHYLLTRF